MGSVTIRNIDDAIKHNARLAAVKNGRSLEAELRVLLEKTYAPHTPSGESSIERLLRLGKGLELQIPAREVENLDWPAL